eukprot:CAMPEP_0115456622 /NCGR_PEP_ID=MMETSP0271-20121206/44784_1 /TAXON_ID=71861 /ORGANISM="Scrippsiella trochoidea, Strain CCMP3099" /LENGTH=332 /DNA_ID=CAMNT_0002883145 /DNA_START=65 /DNA_END=1063 /DNA_ORIENTATION=+
MTSPRQGRSRVQAALIAIAAAVLLSSPLQLISGSAFTVSPSTEIGHAVTSGGAWKMGSVGVYTPPAPAAADVLVGASPRRSEGRFLGSVAVAALLLCASFAKTPGLAKRTASLRSSRSTCFSLKINGHVAAELPASMPMRLTDTNPTSVQTPMQVSTPLLDLEDAAVPVIEPPCLVANAPSTPQVFAPTPKPVVQAELNSMSCWTAPSLRSVSVACSPARRVGGSRRAQPRQGSRVFRAAAATATSARRSVGARLEERVPCPQVAPASYDASRLRTKVQVGLSASWSLRMERGRESKTPASQVTAVSTGVLILANEDSIDQYLLTQGSLKPQ